MRTEMATEKPTLPAPEEPVSPAAEDVQATPAVTAEVPETPNPAAEAPAEAETAPVAETPAEAAAGETEPAEAPAGAEEAPAVEEAPAEEAAPRAKRARIQPAAEPVAEAAEEAAPADVQVDFADEEAALAAQNAGLEIEDETPEEEAACIGYLERQIELISPKIIVCLGRIAAMRLIKPDFRITKEHGIWFERNGTPITATLHPAALLRDPRKKPDVFEDFKKIRAKCAELSGRGL